MRNAPRVAAPALHYEDDEHFLRLLREQEAAKYLWFNSTVRPEDVLEASEHQPKYEMSVTGRKRIKAGTRTVTIGTKVEINGRDVAIFKNYGQFYAIDNTCPHQGASLHLGDIEDFDGMTCISCPRHHWPFSLEDGSCLVSVKTQARPHPVQVRAETNGSKWLFSSEFFKVSRMGSLHSKHSSPQSAPEPAALLRTTAGVIVRIPDPSTGESVFHHNPRFIQPATLSEALGADGGGGAIAQAASPAEPQVLVARAGAKNNSLKGKVVYVKRPPRQQS